MEDLLRQEVLDFHRLGDRSRALLFPPCNSYLRFRLHQQVQEQFGEDLGTFSVGRDGNRRLVLAWKEQVIRKEEEALVKVDGHETKSVVKSAEKLVEEVKKPDKPQEKTPDRRSKSKRPERQVYVPRQRRRREEGNDSNSNPSSTDSPSSSSSPAKSFKNIHEEIAASLKEGVTVVESDVPPPRDEPQHFLTRWLDPEDREENDQEEDGKMRIDESLVLEIYDFDPSLKTGDLTRALHRHRGCYDLRWVDDTHALAVFKTEAEAQKALSEWHGGDIHLRRLADATEASKKRARSLAPPRPSAPRPETSTLVARRMMGGALGVNLVSKNRAEEEGRKIQRARQVRRERMSRDEEDDAQ